MALRLSEAVGMEASFRLPLEAQHDLWVRSRKKRAQVRPIEEIVAVLSHRNPEIEA